MCSTLSAASQAGAATSAARAPFGIGQVETVRVVFLQMGRLGVHHDQPRGRLRMVGGQHAHDVPTEGASDEDVRPLDLGDVEQGEEVVAQVGDCSRAGGRIAPAKVWRGHMHRPD